jgi:putative ABC transport system substrate-binding protein
MMKFIRGVLSALLVLCAGAAGAADKTVGVIMSGNIGYYQDMHKAFANGLIREGFDSRKVDTLLQTPASDTLSWTNAARRLVTAEVNVLVTYGAPAALASIQETKGIPIVFAGVYDPAALGVQTGNAAGISSKVPMGSLLKYLRKLTPFTKLAVVYNEAEPDSVRQVEELRQSEAQYGFQTVKMAVKRPDDARKLVFAGKADAVLISVSAAANEAIDFIVKTARAAKVPCVSQ